jgi:hypothetical protein
VLPPLRLIAMAIALCLGQLLLLKPWTPYADEIQYLTYGRTLAETGRYAGTPAGPTADPQPGREPLYPALIAGVMRLDPLLRANAGRCIGRNGDASCMPIYRSLAWVNALLVAATAVFAFATVRALGGPAMAAYVAGAYVLFNQQIMKELNHVVSDYLAMALASALALAFALALRQPRSALRWLSAGGMLGLLILTKASYLVFGGLFAVIGLLVAIVRRDRAGLIGWFAVCFVAGGLAAGWMVRNEAVFGRAALTDGRGGIALSTREALDHMRGPELAAAYLWWTRGFGAGLAKRLFSEADWHRHEWYVPDGFYIQGQFTGYEARVARFMAQPGVDRPAAEEAVSGAVLREIVADWPDYLATMPAVFYRGLWFDEFVVLGFPAFVWLTLRAVRHRGRGWLLVASPTCSACCSIRRCRSMSLAISCRRSPVSPSPPASPLPRWLRRCAPLSGRRTAPGVRELLNIPAVRAIEPARPEWPTAWTSPHDRTRHPTRTAFRLR